MAPVTWLLEKALDEGRGWLIGILGEITWWMIGEVFTWALEEVEMEDFNEEGGDPVYV